MHLMKAVVIGMGVLILVGFAVVAVTLVGRMQDIREPTAAYKRQIHAPIDGELVETSLSDETIMLRFRGATSGETLVILDLATGQERGRIQLAHGQ